MLPRTLRRLRPKGGPRRTLSGAPWLIRNRGTPKVGTRMGSNRNWRITGDEPTGDHHSPLRSVTHGATETGVVALKQRFEAVPVADTAGIIHTP
jgi:hypothetical protein